jgi:hypothetical protein
MVMVMVLGDGMERNGDFFWVFELERCVADRFAYFILTLMKICFA